MDRDDFPEPLLAEVVAAQVGTSAGELRLRRCATGKFNTTYFVEGGPRPLVLRIAPPDDPANVLFYERHMMRQEPGLLELLRARTSVPVPAVIAFEPEQPRLGRDCLLLERLPGWPLSDHPTLTGHAFGEVLRELGRHLRQVHAVAGEQYGYSGEHRPMEPQPDWPRAFALMWNLLLDDVVRCGGYESEEADSLRRLLDRYQRVFERPVPASLLHMDVWAQNLLVDAGGRLTGLLDWDRALWGDPEIEFAILDYCGISEPPFWEGYGMERDRSPEAEIRRQFYLLYEVQKYIFIRRVRARNPRHAETYRQQVLTMVRDLSMAAP